MRHATGLWAGKAAGELETRKSGDLPPIAEGNCSLSATEGEKLMIHAQASHITARVSERLFAGVLTLAFGLLLLAGAGFAGSDYLHNAAHDTRHALGFPCH